MESKMERMSSSLQSWVDQHKLATIGGVWAAAVGASVAYSRRRATSLIHGRKKALALAVLGGAACVHYYKSSSSKRRSAADMELEFYSQLPPATDADGNENERWSW